MRRSQLVLLKICFDDTTSDPPADWLWAEGFEFDDPAKEPAGVHAEPLAFVDIA